MKKFVLGLALILGFNINAMVFDCTYDNMKRSSTDEQIDFSSSLCRIDFWCHKLGEFVFREFFSQKSECAFTFLFIKGITVVNTLMHKNLFGRLWTTGYQE
nr:hypothetical protein [Providencia rettgeri]